MKTITIGTKMLDLERIADANGVRRIRTLICNNFATSAFALFIFKSLCVAYRLAIGESNCRVLRLFSKITSKLGFLILNV